jgi:hypothetical protein
LRQPLPVFLPILFMTFLFISLKHNLSSNLLPLLRGTTFLLISRTLQGIKACIKPIITRSNKEMNSTRFKQAEEWTTHTKIALFEATEKALQLLFRQTLTNSSLKP